MTVLEVLDKVLGSKDSGPKSHDQMTPTRYGHMVELLAAGVPADAVRAAEQRICASSWLRKPARAVTDDDMARLVADAPWSKP